jgi:hypothetical protein
MFTEDDCHDLVQLTATISPPGSLCLGYNSVGAGASQNHIHCHAWPCPPVPLLYTTDSDCDHDDNGDKGDHLNPVRGWNAYPVSKVESIFDFHDIDHGPSGGCVEVSYLKYPVFCVQLSASTAHLNLLGQALASCMDAIGDAPHNIAFLNRILEVEENEDSNEEEEEEESSQFVDVYVFARSKERSNVIPTLKLGISEMMGIFHAQSDAELNTLVSFADPTDDSAERVSLMELALADISIEDEEGLWQTMKDNLSKL